VSAAAKGYGKYVEVFRLGAAAARRDRASLVGRAGLFVVILLIFSRLWRATAATTGAPGASVSAADLTWYMVVTEWIVCSIPAIHLEVERDAQTGDLETHLTRPTVYAGLMAARGFGQALANAAVLLVVGVVVGAAFTGTLPSSPWILAALPLGVVSIAVSIGAGVGIGLTTVWLGECGPLFWVWHKALFILGGLILPLSFYPEWLQRVAWATPFAPLLTGPARLALGGTLTDAVTSALALAGWGLVVALVVAWTWSRVPRALDGA
jgi:ABC-2 type transport system permease protein